MQQAGIKIYNRHEACYLQIVIVHGGVRESQPGYLESQIAIWSMLFFKISVTSKNVINLIIRTNKQTFVHANKIELSFGYT